MAEFNPEIHKKIYYNGEEVGFQLKNPPPPPEEKQITKLAFKQRMTQAERIAIREAAKTNAGVFDFQDLLDSATYVDLSRQDTIDGVNQLEQAGLLATGRADEIITAPVQADERYS